VSDPVSALDDVVHQRVRLRILAVLAEARRAEDDYLRDSLRLSDGNLSSHLQVLENAGFVSIAEELQGARRRTWVQATPAGQQAFRSRLASLQADQDRAARPPRPQ
jgi:DNA-binding MarR family transcriptional regulator